MRDPELLKREMAEKDDIIMDVAKKLFLEKKMEAVRMEDIINESGFGRATVFRHYKNKNYLVIDLMVREWKRLFDELDRIRPIESIHDIPAIDRFKFTLDFYIDLYKNHRELLMLNDNFNHYITHAIAEDEGDIMKKFHMTMELVNCRFHLMYEKAKEDNSFRTDYPEDEFFRITLHSMMAACGHYAGGFVWGAKLDMDADYTSELLVLKEMLIHFATEK